MSWQLKSYQYSPPGNYLYVQTDGILHEFPANPVIEQLAKDLSKFRAANRLRRPDIRECLEDIDAFQCVRLKNNPVYCVETEQSFSERHASHPYFKPPCPTCGIKMD
jgi:hypothetical protein